MKMAALVMMGLFAAQYPSLGGTPQVRNTFIVATETVIDNANAVDLRAVDAAYDAQIKQLRLSKDNLNVMAEGEREHEIAEDASNLVFLVTACRIQAKTAGNAERCSAQLAAAERRIMESIGKHKASGTWADGPPLQ